jgi:hypothetical protein
MYDHVPFADYPPLYMCKLNPIIGNMRFTNLI